MLIATKQHKKNFFCVCEPALVVVHGFFSMFLTPFTLEGYNFLSSHLFLTIFTVSNVPRGGVEVLFGHQKQCTPPLGLTLP
jgi:hypothetical protein